MISESSSFASDAEARARMSAVYRMEREFVRSVVRRSGIPPADVDDTVQDVFCVLLRRMSELDVRSSLRYWLAAVTIGVCRNRRRTSQRRARWFVAHETEAEPIDSSSSFTLQQRGELERLLAQIDRDQRQVLVLAALEDRSAREIGEQLGISPNTVSSRLRSARRRLLGAFGEALRE